jgi:hypothetical protein
MNTMKKDSIREFMEIAIEAYDFAAVPPSLSVDEEPPIDCPRKKHGNRLTLLAFSLDVKRIYDLFVSGLPPKRAERFATWLKVGYIEQFHSDHRRMLKRDRAVFARMLSPLRHTWEQENG